MLKNLGMFACLISAPWIAIGGLVAMVFGNGVMEVLNVELCALVLAVLAGVLLLDDLAGPRR